MHKYAVVEDRNEPCKIVQVVEVVAKIKRITNKELI
jgi:Tat protein secretion system quality control protein TatD with DNase activity